MMRSNVISRIATLGSIGYLPGSGTIASLCMLPLIYCIGHLNIPLDIQAGLLLIFSVVSFFVISKALPVFGNSGDPSEIVLDECVGMLIAAFALPFSWFTLFLIFFLFRLFDISKFFGLSLFERLPGAWGILLDDVAAAVVANVILRFVVPLACP